MLLGEALNIYISKFSASKDDELMKVEYLALAKASGIYKSRGTSLKKAVSRTFPLIHPALQTP